jgi:hypothetical protein
MEDEWELENARPCRDPANHLSIVGEHAAKVAELPPIHKDPFDRFLAAQARYEPVILLTDDEVLGRLRRFCRGRLIIDELDRNATQTPASIHRRRPARVRRTSRGCRRLRTRSGRASRACLAIASTGPRTTSYIFQADRRPAGLLPFLPRFYKACEPRDGLHSNGRCAPSGRCTRYDRSASLRKMLSQ